MTIRPETPADVLAIREVHRMAFGGAVEAALVDELRAGGYARVSLVADLDTAVVGHIFISPVTLETCHGSVEVLSLAPLSVLPEHQRRGIGTALVKAGLSATCGMPYASMVVLGHPEFYCRFGFQAELASPFKSPFGAGAAWMALELVPGALQGLTGRVLYPPPFRVFEQQPGEQNRMGQ